MAPPIVAGWYGKLPTLGDFASRRLPAEVIEPWDAWLSQGLAHLQTAHAATWLDGYLASPVWRFVVMPGVLPAADPALAWAGVLMPSVDKVGRYFPLSLMAALPPPISAAGLDALHTWLHRLDDLAADALHEDWGVAPLEQALGACPWDPKAHGQAAPFAETPAALASLATVIAGAQAHAALPLPTRAAWAEVMSQVSAQACHERLHGTSFWWAEPAGLPPQAWAARGLPDATCLARMLGGRP